MKTRVASILRLKFIQRMSVYFITGAIQRSLAFLLLPLYAHTLPSSELGQLSLLLAVEIVVGIFLDSGFSQSAVRYFHAREKHEGEIIVSRLYLTAAGYALVVSILAFGALTLLWGHVLSTSRPPASLLALVVISSFLQRQVTFSQQLNRARSQAKAFAVVSVLQIAITTSLTAAFLLVFDMGIEGVLLSRVLGALIPSAIGVVRLVRLSIRTRGKDLGVTMFSIWLFAVPLLFNQLASWGRNMADRFVLANYVPIEHIGLYFTANLIAGIMFFVNSTFDQTFAPFYYRNRRRNTPGFRMFVFRVSEMSFATWALVCIVLMAVSREVFALLFPVRFQAAAQVAPLLIAAQYAAFASQFLMKALFFRGMTKKMPLVTAATTAMGLGTIPLLAPHIGIAAGGVGTLVTSVGSLFGFYVLLRSQEKPDFPLSLLTRLICLITAYGAFLYAFPSQPFGVGLPTRLAVAAVFLAATLLSVGIKRWSDFRDIPREYQQITKSPHRRPAT